MEENIDYINRIKLDIDILNDRVNILSDKITKYCAGIINTNDIYNKQNDIEGDIMKFNNFVSQNLKKINIIKNICQSKKKANISYNEYLALNQQIYVCDNDLKQTFLRYRDFVDKYQKYNKNIFTAKCKMLKPNITNEEIIDLEERKQGGDTLEQIFDNITNRAQLDDIKNRHDDILNVERRLLELQDLYVQMNIIINDNQTIINVIETNVDTALNDVNKAKTAIRISKNYKTSTCKIMCAVFICFGLMLVVLALVLLSVLGKYF